MIVCNVYDSVLCVIVPDSYFNWHNPAIGGAPDKLYNVGPEEAINNPTDIHCNLNGKKEPTRRKNSHPTTSLAWT